MTASELREKLNKAQEAVNKRIATIAKYEAKADKILNQIRAKGWDENDHNCRYGTEEHYEASCLIFDYDTVTSDIKSSYKKLKELQRIAQGWSEKLEKQTAQEIKVATQMPEVFRTLKDQLAEEWTGYDLHQKELMRADRRTMNYKDFNKKWSHSRKEELERPEEQLRARNERDAELFILDLYNRVVYVTGEVTDWSDIRFSGKALNGLVIGKKGKAIVETILAGGYNIQRLHYRVLVKKAH